MPKKTHVLLPFGMFEAESKCLFEGKKRILTLDWNNVNNLFVLCRLCSHPGVDLETSAPVLSALSSCWWFSQLLKVKENTHPVVLNFGHFKYKAEAIPLPTLTHWAERQRLLSPPASSVERPPVFSLPSTLLSILVFKENTLMTLCIHVCSLMSKFLTANCELIKKLLLNYIKGCSSGTHLVNAILICGSTLDVNNVNLPKTTCKH